MVVGPIREPTESFPGASCLDARGSLAVPIPHQRRLRPDGERAVPPAQKSPGRTRTVGIAGRCVAVPGALMLSSRPQAATFPSGNIPGIMGRGPLGGDGSGTGHGG